MEKVLLAIDGMTPDQKAFQYAVKLCKRIKAELDVLQVINPKKYSKRFTEVRKKAKPITRYIGDSFTAAAFAEAGEHKTANTLMDEALKNLKALMAESEKEGVRLHLTMKAGNANHEIIDYVKAHRDVVLTVYDIHHRKKDDDGFARQCKTLIRETQQALPVPLVVIQKQSSAQIDA